MIPQTLIVQREAKAAHSSLYDELFAHSIKPVCIFPKAKMFRISAIGHHYRVN